MRWCIEPTQVKGHSDVAHIYRILPVEVVDASRPRRADACRSAVRPNNARAEIIRAQDMLRGITTTRAQCAMTPHTVWATVYGRDFCVRYYVSTVGGVRSSSFRVTASGPATMPRDNGRTHPNSPISILLISRKWRTRSRRCSRTRPWNLIHGAVRIPSCSPESIRRTATAQE